MSMARIYRKNTCIVDIHSSPPPTYPFIGYVGVVGGGCRTSVLMPGAGQDKAVAAKMAAPHAGGPQFIGNVAKLGMEFESPRPTTEAIKQ